MSATTKLAGFFHKNGITAEPKGTRLQVALPIRRVKKLIRLAGGVPVKAVRTEDDNGRLRLATFEVDIPKAVLQFRRTAGNGCSIRVS